MRTYCSEADLLALEERGIAGYVAVGREGKERAAVDPARRPATHRMGQKPDDAGGPEVVTRGASGSRRRRTAGSGRCLVFVVSASEVWRKCRRSGTWCAWR